MSVTVTWLPNTETDMSHYDLQRAPDVDGQAGTWTDLTTITHDLEGADYDTDAGRFFYSDPTGTLDNWYRVRAVDTDANPSAYSNPFQPSSASTPPPFPNTVVLDEDYNSENNLRYETEGGDAIAEAQVRVYKKVDYDLENYNTAIGVTTTDTTGGWVNPVTVEAGYTYTIEFLKPGYYGPDTKEIVVP